MAKYYGGTVTSHDLVDKNYIDVELAKKPNTDTVTTINGKTGTIQKSDIVALGIPGQDTNTTYTAGTNVSISDNKINATDTKYNVATTTTNGLLSSGDKSKLNGIESGAEKNPDLSGHALKNEIPDVSNFITADQVEDTTYSAGSNITIDGSNVISATNTTYQNAAIFRDGLMHRDDKLKLDGVEAGATKNSAGSNVSIGSDGVISATDTTYLPANLFVDGLMTRENKVKLDSIEVQATKNSAGSNVTIDSLGAISATNTTYSTATTSVNGLMASTDKNKLNGIEAGATNDTALRSRVATLENTQIKVAVVSSLPSTQLPNTLYIVTG